MDYNQLIRELRAIDIAKLNISDYSKGALQRVVNSDTYYFEIYHRCLESINARCNKEISEMAVVDYGGGHGLFSILAKTYGYGNVIYIDNNPDAINTVNALSKKIGVFPDHILEGDSDQFVEWAKCNHTIPDALIAIDVIEHIYSLPAFFKDMNRLSPNITMIFTTASSPYNPFVAKRLHRIMLQDELSGENSFFAQRRRYIEDNHPDLTKEELSDWAKSTRGMTFDDVELAIEQNTIPTPTDRYNTCDPQTGSWTERILSIEAYQDIVEQDSRNIQVAPGMFNQYKKGIKGTLCHIANKLFRLADHSKLQFQDKPDGWQRIGLVVAPFIYLISSPRTRI